MFGLHRWRKSIEFIEGPTRTCLNPYDRDPTEHVLIAQVRGNWQPEMAGFLRDKGAKGLSLHFCKDLRVEDGHFLRDLDFLELLSVPYHLNKLDIKYPRATELPNLKRLALSGKIKHAFDLSLLPNLQSCTLEWQNKLNSVFKAKGLRRLQITSLKWQNADALAELQELENLELAHSGIRSFEPISQLGKLKRLSLSVCHSLEDLRGIEGLQSLRCLHLDEVHRVTDLECLAPLKDLEVLTISDGREIQSVAPLEGLKKLKAVWIAGAKTKIVDGDLSPLTRLPRLAMLTVGNKRHYTHRGIKKWEWGNLNKPDRQLEAV